jgi:hypothetical protein
LVWRTVVRIGDEEAAMASRREKRFERREELSDRHLGVHDEDLGGEHREESPHQERLDGRATWNQGGDPKVLAENLRRLVQRRVVTRQEVWKAIGQEKRAAWFERVLKKGLSRVTPQGRDRLERVAGYFGLTYDDLWRADLITFEVDRPRPDFRRYGEKLADLLASGKHEYLKDLIDTLHEALWRRVRSAPEPEPDDDPIPPPGQRIRPQHRD